MTTAIASKTNSARLKVAKKSKKVETAAGQAKKHSENQADAVLLQLKRIHGQLGGVIKMYEDERACVDIVRQIIAARSSLGRSARDLLTSEAARCGRQQKLAELDLVLKELFR